MASQGGGVQGGAGASQVGFRYAQVHGDRGQWRGSQSEPVFSLGTIPPFEKKRIYEA